jgi:hypothetical protein
MYLKNSKLIAVALIFVWAFVFFGATACLANQSQGCCPDQSDDCPIISLKDTPRTAQLRSVRPDFNLFNVAIPIDFHAFSSTLVYNLVAHRLLNYNLLVKLTHPAHAPPQA